MEWVLWQLETNLSNRNAKTVPYINDTSNAPYNFTKRCRGVKSAKKSFGAFNTKSPVEAELHDGMPVNIVSDQGLRSTGCQAVKPTHADLWQQGLCGP